jgi:hypothetical protein
MKPVEKSFTFIEKPTIVPAPLSRVRRSKGSFVHSYAELVERVAELSFHNPEYLLFYRGQARDYLEGNLTTIHTPIFRPKAANGSLGLSEIERRFRVLERAEEALAAQYNLVGKERVQRYSILRWALLQHYEVCRTPLLDLTHSLRVACSFAFQEQRGNPYLYVFALPQISGSVTTSSEHGIQIIRLLSICPAAALRPHYQEGYLVGEFPTISFRQKMLYDRRELDIANRLVCKFRLANYNRFWHSGFTEIPKEALFPDSRDTLKKKMNDIEAVIRQFFEFEIN